MVTFPEILKQLEAHHGVQKPTWPVDPYEFLLWWHCGYPQSESNCVRGWESLTANTGITPAELRETPRARLAEWLKPGGMIPQLRAERIKRIVAVVEDAALDNRRTLKTFPGIGDPGADRILLFAGIEPVAAVPSNAPQVLVRIIDGDDPPKYSASYRRAQELIEENAGKTVKARQRVYLLLRRHAEICKRSKPKCDICPIRENCRYGLKMS